MADNESGSQLSVGNESESIPVVGFDEAFRELQESLWRAQIEFHSKNDAGRSGAKLSCLAVARFLRVLDQNPLMAAPFFTIRGALDDLDRGVTAELLNRYASDSVRSRSSQKKHLQIMASACLEFLVDKGEPLDQASARVARLVNKWPGIGNQEISATTVRNWRDTIRAGAPAERRVFSQVIAYIRSCENPEQEVATLLDNGPPGIPKS